MGHLGRRIRCWLSLSISINWELRISCVNDSLILRFSEFRFPCFIQLCVLYFIKLHLTVLVNDVAFGANCFLAFQLNNCVFLILCLSELRVRCFQWVWCFPLQYLICLTFSELRIACSSDLRVRCFRPLCVPGFSEMGYRRFLWVICFVFQWLPCLIFQCSIYELPRLSVIYAFCVSVGYVFSILVGFIEWALFRSFFSDFLYLLSVLTYSDCTPCLSDHSRRFSELRVPLGAGL